VLFAGRLKTVVIIIVVAILALGQLQIARRHMTRAAAAAGTAPCVNDTRQQADGTRK